MLSKLLLNIHWLIIFYAAFRLWGAHEEHIERKQMVSSRIPPVKNRIRKTKKELQRVQKYLKDIETEKEKIELAAKQVESLQRQLPSNISDTKNLDIISSIAEKINVQDINLSPGRQDNQGFYITKNYEINARGTFLQFLLLFDRIAKNERLFSIKSLSLGSEEKNQRGRFRIISGRAVIEAFRYNKSFKGKTGIEDIEEEFDDS